MFSIINDLVEQIKNALPGFDGKYLTIYDTSLIDNSLNDLFYIKSRNKDEYTVEIGKKFAPSLLIYDLKLIVQFKDIEKKELILKSIINAISYVCSNGTDRLTLTFDSNVITNEETGLNLKTELNLLRIFFTYKKAIKAENCNPCLKPDCTY